MKKIYLRLRLRDELDDFRVSIGACIRISSK